MKHRGFTLIEVMVAVGLGGVVMASAVSTFKTSLDEQALSKREWQAFTIAQQNMELLSALPRDHTLLSPNAAGAVVPGSAADATCTDVGAGTQHFRVDGLGKKVTGGQYDVCFKVKEGDPVGSLKNVRVVVTYVFGVQRHVVLQTVR